MKISRLRVENFRIFRGDHEFDLKDKKVILIEGSNGHGKSTMFDAINWVFTGEINRFSGSSEQTKFNYLVNNHEFLKKTYRVSVEVDIVNNEGHINTIRREIRKLSSGKIDKKIFVDGQKYSIRDGLRAIIALITRGNFLKQEQKFSSFSSIFASTQILSQETLEDFIKVDKPTDRYTKLENILGLDKYGKELRIYINKSRTALENKMTSINTELKDLESEIKRLDTRYSDNEYIMEYTGEMNESELISNLNKYFDSLPGYYVNYDDIKIQSLEEDEIEKIRKQRKDLENKNVNLQNLVSRIQRYEISNLDLNEERIKLDDLHMNLINTKRELEKREQGKVRAKNRKKQLSLLEDNLDEINGLQEELYDLKGKENEIMKYQSYINSNMGVKEIIKKFNNYSTYIKEFENKKESKEKELKRLELIDKNKELEIINKKLKNIESEIKFKNDQIERVNSFKLEKEEIIEKLNIKKKDIHADNIQQIIFSIQKSILDKESEKVCPVCGSDFKDIDTLLSNVEVKLKEGQEKYDSVEIKISEELSSISSIENEIKSLHEHIELLEGKINVILERKKTIEREKIYIESIIGDLTEIDRQNIEGNIKRLETYINEHEHYYNLIKGMLEKLNELNILREKISLNEKKSENLKEPFKGKFTNVTNIYGITMRVNKLDNYLNENKKSLKQLKLKIVELEYTIDRIRNKIDQINYIIKSLESDYPKIFESFSINDCLLYIKEQSKMILDIDAELVSSLKKISAFKEKDKLSKIQGQKEKIVEVKKNKDKELTLVKENISNIEILKKIHTNVQSNLINKYLRDNSNIINQFFRQISPHAYYKNVKLVTRENDLYVLLSEEKNWSSLDDFSKEQLKEEVNANLNFSAAQSTILALSIFLSLNITQNWCNLNIIGIDDPFQHLDDVNTYSFIDVLTSLINNEEKQIIISTHNKNFSDLLMSKLSLSPQNVQKISINSYSKKHIDIKASNYINLTES
ncbi:AAA family ATPase [Mammaliicoccus sciuri]|nr:SMC family ATPase [Mammaliicoccus sciuri]